MLTPMMDIKNPCVRTVPAGGADATRNAKIRRLRGGEKEEYRRRDAERERNAENYARTVSRKKMDRTAREGRRHYK